MLQDISVHHWSYSDGWSDTLCLFLKDKNTPTREFNVEIIGWNCWVYCKDHTQFINWMAEHCPLADCTARFNSGNPMVTVFINDKDEAAYFKLNFNV